MKVRSGYKQTDLGVIPQDWEIRQFSEHFRIYAGGDAPNHSLSQTQSASHPYPIFANAIQNKGLYGYTAERRSNANSLTITARGYLGHAEYRDQPFFPIVRLLVMEPTGQLDARYTTYAVNDRVKFSIESTGVPQLTAPQVGKYCVAAPATLQEQHIVAMALSDVDFLLAGLDRLIAKKRDLKQAAMQQLLTGQTRLPGFSGAWRITKLGEIAKLYQPETISQSEFTDAGYPVFGANGVVGMYDRFNHETPQITVSCRGNCGTVNRTQGPAWITGNAMVVNLDATEDIDKAFVYYALAHSDLSLLVTGSGIPQIVRGPLEEFAIALPSDPAEQTAIAAVLSDMDAELAALEARRDKTRDLKQAMMQELLTGKTRLVKPEAAHA